MGAVSGVAMVGIVWYTTHISRTAVNKALRDHANELPQEITHDADVMHLLGSGEAGRNHDTTNDADDGDPGAYVAVRTTEMTALPTTNQSSTADGDGTSNGSICVSVNSSSSSILKNVGTADGSIAHVSHGGQQNRVAGQGGRARSARSSPKFSINTLHNNDTGSVLHSHEHVLHGGSHKGSSLLAGERGRADKKLAHHSIGKYGGGNGGLYSRSNHASPRANSREDSPSF